MIQMSDASETTLTVPQVTDIITVAKSGGADPMLVGMQIFSTLGDNVTVSGDILRLALANSAIAITEPLVSLVAAIQAVSKTGNHVTIALNQDIETTLNSNRIRFKDQMNFDAIPTPGAPELNNITGVATHKFVSWINIQSIRLKQNLGHWSVAVGTSLTTVNFDLN
jgi:hypothetical protein